MYRKLIYLMSFVLVPAYFAGQVGAASMGMDGYADRVIVRNDGSGNALWCADATGPGGFGDGIAEVSGGAFGLMTDVLMLGDVSGDGIVDRIFVREVGGFWIWVADYSTATGFGDGVADADVGFGASGMIPHAVVDLDGDGIADRVIVDPNNPAPHYLYYGDKGPAGGGFGDGMNEWAGYFGDADGNTALLGMTDLNNDDFADRVLDWNGNGQFIADLAPAGGGFGDGTWDPNWEGSFGNGTMWQFVGDVSADGYGDRVVAYEVAGGTYTWVAALSTSSGFGSAGIPQEATFGAPDDILLLGDVLVYRQPPVASMGMDGYADRVKICDDGIGNAIWYADTTDPCGFGDGVVEVSGAFGLMTDVHMLGDISGDGIADRVIARVVGTETYWTWWADYSTPTGFGDGVADSVVGFGDPNMLPHAVVDLDGDGIADAVIVDPNNPAPWFLYYGDKGAAGGGFGDGMNEWVEYFGNASGNAALIGMTDLNGDSFADRVLDWSGSGQFIADLAPAGGGFGDGNWDAGWEGSFGAAGMWQFVGDVSADGYGDRVVAYEVAGGTYTWVAALSTSSGFGLADIPQEATFGSPGDILLLGDVLSYCQFPLGDLNKDCKVDFRDLTIIAEHWLEDTRGI